MRITTLLMHIPLFSTCHPFLSTRLVVLDRCSSSSDTSPVLPLSASSLSISAPCSPKQIPKQQKPSALNPSQQPVVCIWRYPPSIKPCVIAAKATRRIPVQSLPPITSSNEQVPGTLHFLPTTVTTAKSSVYSVLLNSEPNPQSQSPLQFTTPSPPPDQGSTAQGEGHHFPFALVMGGPRQRVNGHTTTAQKTGVSASWYLLASGPCARTS
ncbi:hypothetical protein V8C35DRAFT_309077 [Trichoderma chlorosporum]